MATRTPRVPKGPTPVEAIKHKGTRKNIPTEELRGFVKDDEHAPKTMLYLRDPSLDPQLVWKGKDEQDQADLAVPVVPIYIQEKVHPQTMPPDRGLFLPVTWRLAPAVCAFTSELFYEGKLRSREGLEQQRLVGTDGFDGAGLWWMPVPHDGNRNWSAEEVDAVAALVDRLLAPGAAWVDGEGVTRPLGPDDLRVVAPYNAHVNRLAERLAARGVPVGTVDRFQGQEAAVVIYAMGTSRPEDAPRGLEFLYSLNRLNVATSRARCAVVVVASPRLLEPECRTPRQMQLANALCRYVELAREL
jgi:uncharacterized protein